MDVTGFLLGLPGLSFTPVGGGGGDGGDRVLLGADVVKLGADNVIFTPEE